MLPFESVTVVGCGLIGSSFALAVKQRNLCRRILGWDARADVIEYCLAAGIIEGVDERLQCDHASQSKLLYLAMPVGAILDFLRRMGPRLGPGAIVTDCGSTKTAISLAASQTVRADCAFVPGHPICGSHLSGAPNADANLFEGAPYALVTDCAGTSTPAFQRVLGLVNSLGATPVVLSAAEHDRAVAVSSHLPQLVSCVLARLVEHQEGSAAGTLAGSGLRDMTRLSASSWKVWESILATNAANVFVALDAAIEMLSMMRAESKRRHEQPEADFTFTRSVFR